MPNCAFFGISVKKPWKYIERSRLNAINYGKETVS